MIAYAAGEPAHIALANSFLSKFETIILFPLMTLMGAVAFLVFMYGVFEYVRNAENETARGTGKKHMMYGVIGFVVMFSALAILKVALNTVGCNIDIPGGCQ